MFGLSRIHPETFLAIPKSRDAIREELFGLLGKDKFGIPVAALVRLGDSKWEKFDTIAYDNGNEN